MRFIIKGMIEKARRAKQEVNSVSVADQVAGLRAIAECIINKIVISKEEITIDLCYLPSSKEPSKRNWSLGAPFPFCHIRLKWTRNRFRER